MTDDEERAWEFWQTIMMENDDLKLLVELRDAEIGLLREEVKEWRAQYMSVSRALNRKAEP